LTNLTYTEPALVINSSQQERRLTCLNYVLLEVCAIRKETLGCFRTVSFVVVAVVLEEAVPVEEFK
jgi:hypothetical protein